MANENIGTIPCPFGSGAVSFIRRKKNPASKTPFYIWSEKYGQTFMNSAEGQDYILEHGSMYGIEGEPEPEKIDEKPPQKAEKPEKIPYKEKPAEKPINEPAPKKAGILDGWL